MTEPLQSGASKGHLISQEDLKTMLDEYYTVRGWDLKTGIPTKAKLVELGLADVADQLRHVKLADYQQPESGPASGL